MKIPWGRYLNIPTWSILKYYNNKMKVSGHLFQGRFFSCVLDERHMIVWARYIERNPVRANLVRKPCLWSYSSATIHCGIDQDDPLGTNQLFAYIEKEPKEWKKGLRRKLINRCLPLLFRNWGLLNQAQNIKVQFYKNNKRGINYVREEKISR